MDPTRITVKVYFFDKLHRLESGPHVTLDYDATDFEWIRVWNILDAIQTTHAADCKTTPCGSCFGKILAKSAWLLDKAPDALPKTSFELEHDPANGFQFMQPKDTCGESSRITGRSEIFILCEAAFEKQSPSAKRHLTPDFETTKRARLAFPLRRQVHRVPSEDPGAIHLPLQSHPFSSFLLQPGTVIIDKSQYIFPFDDLLASKISCYVVFPPKTGKTAFMSTYATWRDIGLEPDVHDQYFRSMNVHHSMDPALVKKWADNPDAPPPISRRVSLTKRSSFCLIFDFHKVREISKGDSAHRVTRSIDEYLSHAILIFADKYQGKLGITRQHLKQLKSPGEMMDKVFVQVASQKAKLFIGVDHWDFPIIRSLELHDDFTTKIGRHITEFIFLLATSTQRQSKVANLLVFGNIPPFHVDLSKFLHHISRAADIDGAFGITPKELEAFFDVMSHNRGITLSVDEDGLARALGRFTPPHLFDKQPLPSVFNFDLVLHHVTTTLNLGGPHQTLGDSPLLRIISRRYEKSLRYSSLRRGRRIVISKTRQFDVLGIGEKEINLWLLLLYLGVLIFPKKPSSTWTLEICSTFVQTQLFSDYTPLPSVQESIRDLQLRALLEGNPEPMAKGISRLLWGTHLLDLYEMDEAVLQQVWNCFMNVNHSFVDDGDNDFKEDSVYLNNYFSQLGLLTNASAKQSKKRSQAHEIFTAGRGRFGFLDIFLCDFQDLRPGRVVATELKYFPLRGLFRAQCSSDKECHDKVYGTGDKSTFWDKCGEKLNQLDAMSEEEVQNLDFHFYASQGDGKPARGCHYQIGTIVNEGRKQLKSYMHAIVNGTAFDRSDKSAPEGITRHETRVQATKVSRDKADDLIGLLMYAVGRRVFWAIVEPTEQNTKYRYTAKSGWVAKWGKWGEAQN
ncbi:hypothetical protein C8R45DRAFT_980175 [Mycena sanguinolenta]|nr:hypothetical protein C8R45DRAFT_980175 [Mycena sanguinolenta]